MFYNFLFYFLFISLSALILKHFAPSLIENLPLTYLEAAQGYVKSIDKENNRMTIYYPYENIDKEINIPKNKEFEEFDIAPIIVKRTILNGSVSKTIYLKK